MSEQHTVAPLSERRHEFEPKIAAFVCNWCTDLGADLEGFTEQQIYSMVESLV